MKKAYSPGSSIPKKTCSQKAKVDHHYPASDALPIFYMVFRWGADDGPTIWFWIRSCNAIIIQFMKISTESYSPKSVLAFRKTIGVTTYVIAWVL